MSHKHEVSYTKALARIVSYNLFLVSDKKHLSASNPLGSFTNRGQMSYRITADCIADAMKLSKTAVNKMVRFNLVNDEQLVIHQSNKMLLNKEAVIKLFLMFEREAVKGYERGPEVAAVIVSVLDTANKKLQEVAA